MKFWTVIRASIATIAAHFLGLTGVVGGPCMIGWDWCGHSNTNPTH